MDQVTSHFNQIRDKIGASVQTYVDTNKLPNSFQEFQQTAGLYLNNLKETIPENIEKYYTVLKNTSKDEILNDITQLKVTPATVTLSITTIATVLLVSRLLAQSSDDEGSKSKKKNSKKKQKKKLSRAQKANKEIQQILDFVEEKYVPEIDEYLENYSKLDSEKIQYTYNYFQEMLLKELMKLDGVDVSGNEVLRDNRKKVIKFIQDHQARLDKFKKEAKF